MHQSQSRPNRKRTDISTLTAQDDGKQVLVRARIQASRLQGNKMVFLNLRQRTNTVQSLMTVTKDTISKQMVKWAGSLSDESIVLVEGIVKKSPEPIKSASVSEVEIHITEVSISSRYFRSGGDNHGIALAFIWYRKSFTFLTR